MEEFVFKKWDYGLINLSGYFSRRQMLPNLMKYEKYKIGTTKNNIPIYKWNWVMWYKVFIHERKRPKKDMGIMGQPIIHEDSIVKSGVITKDKDPNREPDKEFM